MSIKVPQRLEYEGECVGVCHSAESNCARAVWLCTLLPSVYSFSRGRCFQNLAQSKDEDGGAQAARRDKLPNARVYVCVCALSTPIQNVSLRPTDESEVLRNFLKNFDCDYSNPFPTCCTCSKEKANPLEKLRLLSLCSPFPAVH